MKSYIKFAMLELIIMIILLMFCSFMIHISDNGNAFIPNHIVVYFLIPNIFLVIFGCLMGKLSTISLAHENELLIFSILNLIIGITLIAFNFLLLNSVIPTGNFLYFWQSFGSGHTFVLSGFNLAYSFISFKKYILLRKNTANRTINIETTVEK